MILNGRACVVTGGFGVLGRAVVARLVGAGATVAVVDHADGVSAEGAALGIGRVDLSDPAQAEAAIGRAAFELGGLYALVNVAGGFRWETLADGDLSTWDRMYAMNVKTAAAASRAALPHLLAGGRGRIVSVAAYGALKAAAGMGAYAASKAGVIKLTEALSEEVKAKGITVNAVLPTILDTQANRKDMPDADPDRWVKPEDLAEVIAFLLSDGARAITGAAIPVTGLV